MENLNASGEAVREYYRNQGRVQQYLRIRKVLAGQLCFDSKLESCDHDYCSITWDLLKLIEAPGCITCYYPKDKCRCEDQKNRAKYADNE